MLGWLIVYYHIALLCLLPIALVAVGLSRWQRTHPRVVFRVAAMVVAILGVISAAECVEALVNRSWSWQVLVHVSITAALASGVLVKARTDRAANP
jgi:hypothetical protein